MMTVIIDGNFIQLWPFIIFVFLILLIRSWRQKHSVPDLISLTTFFIYVLFLVDIVFFPFRIDSGIPNREEGFRYGINLIPFNWDFSFIPHIVLMQIFQNILLTVPFGFGINFVMKTKPKDLLWISLTVGIGIELIQFLISFILVRYTYRVLDINDVILNTLGMGIGYGLFRVFGMVFMWMTQKIDLRYVEQVGILAHTQDIIQRHRYHQETMNLK